MRGSVSVSAGVEADFYRTTAQACFTLLGLWWLVAQFKYGDWVRTARGRALAYDISLFFLLPGVMSLVSLLAADTSAIWRVGFGLFAAAGALRLVRSLRSELPGETAGLRIALALSAALYAAVVFFALVPDAARDLLDLRPLQVEGLLLSAQVFLGVNLAWLVFIGPGVTAADTGREPER
jgi:hypothetical protein